MIQNITAAAMQMADMKVLLIFGVVAGAAAGNQEWLAFNPIVLEFIFGMALYRFRSLIPANGLLIALCLAAAVGLYLALPVYISRSPRFVMWGIPALFLMIGVVASEAYLNRIKATVPGSILKMLGDTSYSMYLVHPFVVAASAIVIRMVPMNDFVAAGLMAALSIFAGYVTWRVIEKPVTFAIKKRARGRDEAFAHPV